MKNLFKYAASYWKAMIAIMLILFVQAYCDLSLPAYTSNIVNVGIQQGGIEDEIPEQIAREEMDKLLLFVSEEDGQKVMDAYEEDTESYEKDAYVLKESVSGDEEQMKELQDILKLPMMMTTGFESGSDMTKEVESQLKSSLPDGTVSEDTTIFDIMKMLPGEQRTAMVEKMGEQMDDLPDTILDQAAVSYCKSVYQDLGMDMEKIQTGYLAKTGGMMIALAFLGMAASVLVGFLASRVGASAGRDLRGRVFHKVVGFSNHEFNQFSTASLITRSTNDIQQIQMLIVMLLRMVLYAPILAIGGVFQVMKTNVSMSWIIGLAVIIIACMVLLLFVVAMPKFKMLQKLVDKLNLVTREILTGLSVIRAFSTEKHEEKRFDDANVELTKTNLFVNRAMTFMMPAMMLVMNGVSVLIVWTGAHGISDGQMQVGDMMAFIQYTMQIIMGFLMLCMISIMLPRAAVAADRVEEVLKSETIICDPERPEVLPEQGEGVLSFDHVSFKYPGADEDVLQDITFTARPGQTTAIIGSTGSGKSTIAKLIMRFHDVTKGSILLNEQDLKTLSKKEIREHIAYVPQTAWLFSGTIADNLRYGNENATEDEMYHALKVAQAEFVEKLEDGLQTNVAQGGTNFSGGQKQRLCIARALIKKADIYVFDDSFSALDFKTDRNLRKALAKELKNAAVLIIAQRINTILNADQIIVLNDGKVVGIGKHHELMENCTIYQEIAKSQMKGDVNHV